MISALLLSASLWIAGQEAGARSDAQAAIVPVEAIADDVARDLAWVIGAHAADLYSTAWALHRGQGSVVEGNPLGPTPEARIALKVAYTATTGLVMWKLRRDGHGRAASILRWAYVAIAAGLTINNSYLAVKAK